MKLHQPNFHELLNFDQKEGIISFRGNRMLLFNTGALSQLRDELVKSLGEDMARGVLTRFGFRCGYDDVLNLRNMFDLETDAEWMLAGPMMHTLEGLVHVSNKQLEFDRCTGSFYMNGIWRNSYEVEHHLKLYGQSAGPVCWTLSGYASGYASGFMGKEMVCVETMCTAKGDAHCAYEIRPAAQWGPEAAANIQDLKPNTVVKSLQKLVAEERERVVQWRALNEAAVEITTNYDSGRLPKKFIQYAKEMVFARSAHMALVLENGQYLVYHTSGGEVLSEVSVNPGPLLSPILNTGRAIVVEKDFLGVPLYYKGSLTGAMVVVREPGDRTFSRDDQELLLILGAQAAISIENARLYERTDEKLQEKVLQLNQLNHVLTAQHNALRKSTDIHNQLTGLVLEGKGIDAIARTLSEIISCPVWVKSNSHRLIASSGAEGLASSEECFSIRELLADKRFAEEMQILFKDKRLVTLPIDASSKKRQIIVPIVAGKEVLGYVSALAADKVPEEQDYIALEQAGTVFALELLKQKAANAVEMRLKEDFIEDLLAGTYESEEAAYHRANQLGFELKGLHQVLTIDVENVEDAYGGSTKRKIYEIVKEVVRRESPESIVINRNRNILVMATLDSKSRQDLVRVLEEELNKQCAQMTWWLAAGGRCSRLDEYKESYKQARTALDIMKSLNQQNRVMAYERLGIFAMLEINKERFAAFAYRVIGPLIEYDRKHNSQLISTLDLYYRHNGNVLKAAKHGFLNHSTMKYRLKRIEEIAGIDLNDPDVGLQVQLALKLIT